MYSPSNKPQSEMTATPEKYPQKVLKRRSVGVVRRYSNQRHQVISIVVKTVQIKDGAITT